MNTTRTCFDCPSEASLVQHFQFSGHYFYCAECARSHSLEPECYWETVERYRDEKARQDLRFTESPLGKSILDKLNRVQNHPCHYCRLNVTGPDTVVLLSGKGHRALRFHPACYAELEDAVTSRKERNQA